MNAEAQLKDPLREALQRIVNGVDDGVMTTSWDAAECRAIAREALAASSLHDPDPDTNLCRRCGLGRDTDWSVSEPQDEHGNYLPCCSRALRTAIEAETRRQVEREIVSRIHRRWKLRDKLFNSLIEQAEQDECAMIRKMIADSDYPRLSEDIP